MQILFFIGNGFDLNAGLDTGANSFVRKLKRHLEERRDTLAPGAKYLLESLRADIETWADFEIALGRFTEEVETCEKPDEAFEEAYVAFHDYFSEEITAENSRAEEVEISQEVATFFRKSMVRVFDDVMNPVEKSTLNSAFRSESCAIRFITFNYTCLLDRLVEMGRSISCNTRKGYPTNLEMPLHIHGMLADEYGILVGVDNEEQIVGRICRESSSAKNLLIKPVANDRVGMRRNESAIKLIDSSDIVAVYGMSMGKSDAGWWGKLATWLGNQNASKRLLVIAKPLPNYPSTRHWERPRLKEGVVEEFLDKAGVEDESVRDKLASRILVAFGSNIFDLGIPMPERAVCEDTE